MDNAEIAAIRDAVMDAIAPTLGKMIADAIRPALTELEAKLISAEVKRVEDSRYLTKQIEAVANIRATPAQVPAAEIAAMRDSIASSIAPTINSQITDAVTQLRLLADQHAQDLLAKHAQSTAHLIARVDDIAGQLDKLHRMDRYQVTKRALVKLMEQTTG